jgi:hypothetical protein
MNLEQNTSVKTLHEMLFGHLHTLDMILNRADGLQDEFNLHDYIEYNDDAINVFNEPDNVDNVDNMHNLYDASSDLRYRIVDLHDNMITGNRIQYIPMNFNDNMINVYDYIIPLLHDDIDKTQIGINDIDKVSIKLKLSDIEINNYKKNDELCIICMEHKGYNGYEIRKTLCNHEYCNECISKWLEKSKKCPCCMANLEVLSTIKIKN